MLGFVLEPLGLCRLLNTFVVPASVFAFLERTRPMQVLSDAQWAVLRPLLDAVRPRGKTAHRDLRRTIEAILWRHQNGAKWRGIPAELGPWWSAAQTFIR